MYRASYCLWIPCNLSWSGPHLMRCDWNFHSIISFLFSFILDQPVVCFYSLYFRLSFHASVSVKLWPLSKRQVLTSNNDKTTAPFGVKILHTAYSNNALEVVKSTQLASWEWNEKPGPCCFNGNESTTTDIIVMNLLLLI